MENETKETVEVSKEEITEILLGLASGFPYGY